MTPVRKEESTGFVPSFNKDEESRPRELFRRAQKRDGTIVDFDREKITEAIWAAARSVGGSSRSTADLLADRVILYLARIYDDHLLTIEEIQDAVEKVLIEQGHAKTAKAYILYREKRAQERSARKEASKPPAIFGKSPISVQSSHRDRVRWDRKRIVEALLQETTIPRKFAEQIAREIEQEIINGKMRFVTSSLIREMVNCKLIEHNLGRKLEITHKPLPQDDPLRRRPDLTLARKLLSYEPRVSLGEGIKKTIEYFKRILGGGDN